MRHSAPLLACLLLAGCAEMARDSAYVVERLESGAPHAINDLSRDPSALRRLAARVELEIGEVDGVGPAVFGGVTALEVDERGDIYVLDGHAQEVRVFAADGSHRVTMGGRGEGPGEFLGAGGLNVDHDGVLWVWDPRNTRFTSFSSTGEYHSTVRRGALGVVLPWPGEFDADNHLIDWSVEFPEQTGGMDMGRTTVLYPIRTSLRTGARDTLPPLEYRMPGAVSPRAPHRSRLVLGLSPDGVIWFAITSSYTVHGRTLAGDTLLAISLHGVEPEPLTPAERDSILRAPDPVGDMTGSRLTSDDLPAAKPLIERIVGDGAGTLYVFPRIAGHEPGSVVDVFSTADGRLLGRVELPRRLALNPRPVAWPGGLIGVTRGELDVPYVVRIGIARADP